jgi:hypothetical protein
MLFYGNVKDTSATELFLELFDSLACFLIPSDD